KGIWVHKPFRKRKVGATFETSILHKPYDVDNIIFHSPGPTLVKCPQNNSLSVISNPQYLLEDMIVISIDMHNGTQRSKQVSDAEMHKPYGYMTGIQHKSPNSPKLVIEP
ncbi:hypothetical protein ACJX0J_013023, partial [Zea mays]